MGGTGAVGAGTIARLGRGNRPFWGYLLLNAGLLVVAVLLPSGGHIVRTVVGALAVAALVVGIRLHRPTAGQAWWLITLGALLAVAAAASISTEAGRLLLPGDWPSTVLWALSFPFLIMGLVRLGGGAAMVDTLDAAVIALAVFLLLFALAIHPVAAGDRAAITASVVFSVGTLLVFAAAVRTVLANGIPSTSVGLLLLAVCALVAALVTVLLLSLAIGGHPASPPTDILWVVYSILLGMAGLHLSLGRVRQGARRGVTMSARRTTLLVILAVVTPVAWGVEIRRAAEIDTPTILGFGVPVVVSTLLLVLLVARLALTARMAEERADQLTHRSDELAESVKEQELLQQQLRHQAMHDPLTGLANRLVVTERMEWELSRPRSGPYALAVLDLDGFKDVNDTLGHPMGDQLIVEAAHRLLRITPSGGILARLGGDEFAALLADMAPERALAWCERARQVIRQPYHISGHDLYLTASVGLLTMRTEGRSRTPADSLRDADLALYAAKAAGRNRTEVFRPELRAAKLDFSRLSTGLRRAVGNGELAIHYQPVIDLTTNRAVAAEALLRWTPSGQAPVAPAEFIPVAEETGMISPIGAWAIRQACRDARPWYERHGIAVAVNVSARQLEDPGFADMALAALEENGLPGSALILEITESSLIATAAGQTVTQLERLRAHRVRVAIDDFGTGYSSLAYVSTLPVDIVKIDRSFVQNPAAAGGSPRWDFTRALLQLVQTLELETLAEGVETAEQAQALRELRCQLAQGHLFARPMPPEALERKWSAENGLAYTTAAATPAA